MSSTFWHAIVALVAASYYANSWAEEGKCKGRTEAVIGLFFSALSLYLFGWAVDGIVN